MRSFILAVLIAAGSPASAEPLIVGAQLYTARDALARDFPGTLRAIARAGYRDVEVAGLGPVDARVWRLALDRAGLRALSYHADWKQLRDAPGRTFADARTLGARYVVLAWLPPEQRASAAQWRIWADRLNDRGVMARQHGLRIAYHPHDFEFGPVEGVIPFELLLRKFDPRFVNFQIDVYWAAKAGRDPVALIAALGRRAPLLHLKDINCQTRRFADIGDGCIDWPAVMAAARKAGVTHAYIERDDAADPVRSLTRSLTKLRRLAPDRHE